MSILVDVNETQGSLNQLEKDLAEAVGTQDATPAKKEAAPAPAPAADSDDNLPPKLRGKSREQIAEMYANLESAHGRMANDLGTQRKLTDRLLDLKRTDDLQQNTPAQAPEVKVSGSDLLDNPKETLDRYFEHRMAQIEAAQNQQMASVEANMAEQQFNQYYGAEAAQVANDPVFQQFVNGTPLRVDLAQRAAQGDYEAANALMAEWVGTKALLQQAQPAPAEDTQQEEANPLAEAQKAQLESAASGSGASSGKVYSRAQLIELKITKPHLYSDPAFQAEIMKAYQEGRVK